jgi:hypothetical protein
MGAIAMAAAIRLEPRIARNLDVIDVSPGD